MQNGIHIRGAREHNLKDVELTLPRGQLVVVTGVSGSGKSTLVFDTLYAEGYRQYVESLSAKARQMMENVPRPNVDFIHGLSPVIALEQHTGGGEIGRKQTVADASEVSEYAKIVWTVCGQQICPQDSSPIKLRSLDDCLKQLLSAAEKENANASGGVKALVIAEVMRGKVAVLRESINGLTHRGYQRIRLRPVKDEKADKAAAHEAVAQDAPMYRLDDTATLTAKLKTLKGEHILELVVDRVVVKPSERTRLADSLELAFKEGSDKAVVLLEDKNPTNPTKLQPAWKALPLRLGLASEKDANSYDDLTRQHFDPYHPKGACPTCEGQGEVLSFVPELVVPDPSKSVYSGALKAFRLGSMRTNIRNKSLLRQLSEQVPFDIMCPWSDLPGEVTKGILHGFGKRTFKFKFGRGKVNEKTYPGVLAELEESVKKTQSEAQITRLRAYMSGAQCPSCGGQRMGQRARNVWVEGTAYTDFLAMDVQGATQFIEAILKKRAYKPAADALEALLKRLQFLQQVGLHYLSLSRMYGGLSGGEAQRVRLAKQLGLGLTGVCYVLDEPSAGLHATDQQRLIACMQQLRNDGSSVVVVEHDLDTMRAADHIVELGPGAGTQGGHLLFEGTLKQCLRSKKSITGPFLNGKAKLEKNADVAHPLTDPPVFKAPKPSKAKKPRAPKPFKPTPGWVTVHGATENNLKNVTASIPTGCLTVVCGTSGSGKSTLIKDILANAARLKLSGAKSIPGRHQYITGLDDFLGATLVDQSPIGRSPRSNPATFTKLFDALRELYSNLSLSKVRGYTPGRFSFNTRGGRCERCQGDGQIKLDLSFLGDTYVPCPSCDGARYNRETLEVRFKEHSIADVLKLTVDDALELFKAQPRVRPKLEMLSEVGLGYLQLGQAAQTLSGGEAQRLKLATELAKKRKGSTLYILDEPTTGLHLQDVQKLTDLLFRLRDAGHTLIVIEHSLELIELADWVLEMGPGGGKEGGELIYAGPPSGLKNIKGSPTGQALNMQS